MKFFYVHLQAIELFPTEGNTLMLDSTPVDTLCAADGFWAFGKILELFHSNTDLKVKYEAVNNLKFGPNNLLASKKLNFSYGFYKVLFNGHPGVDHLAAFQSVHLIASELGLKLLRDHGVLHAEADWIDIAIEEYFANNRHFFWMPEPVRSRFIQQFGRKC